MNHQPKIRYLVRRDPLAICGGWQRHCVRAAVVLLAACVASWAHASGVKFSPEAWQSAPSRNKQNWSRDTLLSALVTEHQLVGLDRAKVIALLGEPGVSNALYYAGSRRDARIDAYRISARNDHSFRIDYDAMDKVSGDFIEAEPCGCPLCADAPSEPRNVLPMKTLEKTVLKGGGDRLTIAQLEALLGLEGKRSMTTARVGGQVWAQYQDLWKIDGSGVRYFLAWGHVPYRNWKDFAEAPIDSYSVYTVGSECFPR